MKNFGYLLITVGFLGAALAAVVEVEQVRWEYFAVGMAVGIAGVILVRLGHKSTHTSEDRLASNMAVVKDSIEKIAAGVARLDDDKLSIETYEMRHEIDKALPADLERFVEARESIAHVHGLQAYADVMSRFAAGERYLNRVWSASADGYVDEVNEYIGKAREQFEGSLEHIRRL